MGDLRLTPLNALHKELGGKMVPFAGWEMPVTYTSIGEEHAAALSTAGFFDVGHMGVFEASGPAAARNRNMACRGGMTDLFTALVADWGVPALALITFLSCLALPVPASLAMLSAGAFVASGDLPIFPTLAAAFAPGSIPPATALSAGG